MTTAAPRKFAFIDALRGLAFLGVLACHLGQYTPGLPRFPAALLNNGDKGVQLFFVVSALTLFLSLDSRKATGTRPMLAFFIRRFFRIAPLFFLGALLYLAILGYHGIARGHALAQWTTELPPFAAILATLTFTNGWDPDWINLVVPGGWSIAVEMNFYLLVPFLFRRLRTLDRMLWFALAASVGACLANVAASRVLAHHPVPRDPWVVPLFLRWWLPNQLQVFALGFILFWVVRSRLEGGEEPQFGRAALAFSTAVYLYAALASAGVDWTHPFEMPLYGGVVFLAAYALALFPLRAVVNPLLCHAGKVSFSGYLAHFAVLRGANRILLHVPLPNPEVRLIVLSALVLAGTLAVATVTYHLVEVPGQALGKRLIAWLERERTPATYPAPEAAPA